MMIEPTYFSNSYLLLTIVGKLMKLTVTWIAWIRYWMPREGPSQARFPYVNFYMRMFTKNDMEASEQENLLWCSSKSVEVAL